MIKEGEGVRRDRSHWTAWSLWIVLWTGTLNEIEVEGVTGLPGMLLAWKRSIRRRRKRRRRKCPSEELHSAGRHD